VINVFSSFDPLFVTLGTGTRFVHVAVLELEHVLSNHCASLAFAYIVTLVGSFSNLTYVVAVEYAFTIAHAQLHTRNSYCTVHPPGSVELAVRVIFVVSVLDQLFVNVGGGGATLFHVHVATAQVLSNNCASNILYENTVTHGSPIVLTNVFVDEITVHQHAFHVYHLYHHHTVHPGSVPFAVNVILLHSFALKFKLFAVGATLLHVAVFHSHALSNHCLSFTFTYLHVVHGSVNVTDVVDAVCHAILVVHVLLLYH
jgi:hypothetical protein